MLHSIKLRVYIAKFSGFLLIILFFSIPILSSVKLRAKDSTRDSTLKSSLASCEDVQFKQAPEFATGDSPLSVATGDFDGDGKIDIAASFSSATSGFSILRNIGGNQFADKQDFILSKPPSYVFAKDLDSDGKPDLVLTYGFDKQISVFRNISPGDGTVNFATKIDYAVGGGQARQVAFGDVDGDGKTDVVTANADTSSGVSILRNISAGVGSIALAAKVDFPLSSPTKAVTLGDFDGDGKLDIATGNEGSRDVRILKNTSVGMGSISFSSSTNFSVSGTPNTILANDFDGDGRLDLAVIMSLNNFISILRNTGSEIGSISFSEPQNFDTGLAPFGGVLSDFDSDGKTDIATVNNNGNSISVIRNMSSGASNTSFAPRSWDYGAGITAYHLALGDFNADGKTDIVTANREGNNVSVLVNNRTGSGVIDFIARKDYLTLNKAGVTNIVSADFDGDGDLDLAASLDEIRNVFKFSVYVNDGSGHFPTRIDLSPINSLTPFIEPFFVSDGDIDNDGRTDLVMVGVWRDPLGVQYSGARIFRNISTGANNISFELIDYKSVFSSPSKVSVVDLDGDGKKDLIVTHRPSGGSTESASVFLNTSSDQGTISFNKVADLPLPSNRSKLVFADLNLDNKIDIVYSGLGYNFFIIVQLNTSSSSGQISFAEQNISIPQSDLAHPVIVDMDSDGKKDLVAQSGDGDISVFGNTSTGGVLSFAERVVFRNIFLTPISSGDINNDGKIDVISKGRYSGAFVSILKNTSTVSGIFNFRSSANFAFGGNTNGSNNESNFLTGDFDNNGKLDIAVGFKGSNIGTISILLNKECISTLPKTLFDYDGDGKSDVSVFRPETGIWHLLQSQSGYAAPQFGLATDKLVPADYDGDGKTDLAVFRENPNDPGKAKFFILQSSNNQFREEQLGSTGDIPVAGDWDGDGRSDIGVYRAGTESNQQGYFYYRPSSQPSVNFIPYPWGIAGDKPVVADYDGDGKAEPAVFRPSTGGWFVQRSRDGFYAIQFGAAEDRPVVGDYDGDEKADQAVFRPSNGVWYIWNSRAGFSAAQFGISTDKPVPADYDGDGKTDLAVYRDGGWFILNSTNGFTAFGFGTATDNPVPNAFVP